MSEGIEQCEGLIIQTYTRQLSIRHLFVYTKAMTVFLIYAKDWSLGFQNTRNRKQKTTHCVLDNEVQSETTKLYHSIYETIVYSITFK